MNLQYERIASLCKQLKLDRVASDWGALAQHTATTDASLADSRGNSASRNATPSNACGLRFREPMKWQYSSA